MTEEKKRVSFRTGTRVYLRPFEAEEAATLQRWINDPEVTQYLSRTHPVTLREEKEWIESHGKSEKNVVLAIVTTDGDRLIGSIGLHGINLIDRTATTGTTIGERDCWCKGYGTEAKMLLLDFAFNTLDLHSVLSEVIAFNGRSLKYAEKCGYVEVGRIPSWFRRNSEHYDSVMLVVTQERWQPLWEVYAKAHDAESK